MTLELLQCDNAGVDRPSAGNGERSSHNEVAACLENAFRHAAKEYRDTRGPGVDEGKLIRFTLPGCVPDGMVEEMYRIGMTRADLARQRQNLQTKCLDMIARVMEF